MIKKFLCAFVAFCAMLCLCSCSAKQEKYTSYSFEYFDTVTSITGYAESREEFDRVCESIYSMLGEYHKLYDIYKPYDGAVNLHSINVRAGEAVAADAKIISLLDYAKEAYALTGGYTNVAMGSVLSIWHEYREKGERLPLMSELLSAADHTDINDVIIDKNAGTVCLFDEQMSLDVGALAKGYAVERVCKSLEAQGISSYILNVGGNVRVIGAKPDGSPWTVGIERADGEGYEEYLSLSSGSVVTSGSYQRYYYVDGVRYHHIISPDTLMPENKYVSVSVVTEDSGLGDALSTALFSMDIDEGLALIEDTPSAEAMWVFADGKKAYSSGFEKYIKK